MTTAPTTPRLASERTVVEHDSLVDEDEWLGETVAGADLARTSAEHVRIVGTELRGVTLTAANLHRCTLTDVRLVECELSGAMFTESQWLRVEVVNCRMSGVVVSQSRLRHVRFAENKLDGADFRIVSSERVVFDQCALPDADFYDARLQSVDFDRCDLRRAHMSGVVARELRLHGSQLEGLRGAASLRGASITFDQVFPLALGLFNELGITVTGDDPDAR
jgi:uncharacterized protein YjbI with pentapeptide repeats